jgi:hypothetical protein
MCDRTYAAHAQPPVGTFGDPTRECEGFKPWPSFKQLAPNLAKGFTDVDFAGKNVRYDLRILSAEFARANVEWSYMDARIVDADRLEHVVDAAATLQTEVILAFVNMNEGGRAVMMDGGPCDLRCCMGDGGWLALQSRLAEEGSKPRQGALAEDRRLERCRKGAT